MTGVVTLALVLSACGGSTGTTESATSAGDGSSAAEAAETSEAVTEVEVTDNHGTYTIDVPPTSVVATDNRLFETLADWGIELAAAPVSLMAPDNPYTQDTTIVDLGNHVEPDLEAVVAAQPDLILNGQRFAQYYEDLQSLAPDAVILELDPRDGEPFDEELRRQVEVLGEVFGHEEDAAALVDAFDAAIARVEAAYDPSETVMAVITSGGTINYAAPSTGRTLGPVFDILGLTPALEQDGTADHQGDEISVEAIAESNPDWILVMDRDAAVAANSGDEYTPANELIASSEALVNVTAVQEGNIVYMPQYTYLDEGIQTYTTFFNALADAMEAN